MDLSPQFPVFSSYETSLYSHSDGLPPAHTKPLFYSQVYCCRPLALAFLELTVVQRFHTHTHSSSVPPSLQAVLRRLGMLYSLWSLNRHMALLYRGEAGA